ncbi:hypothetical protein K457DRAFT_128947 [Linnemannia elongata AG-77]|uniref:Uncharacterized protein n=1 Tax=Linnemannia elongata AG-77 TaxID=1314771 RepID=A0A197JM08_9FUNG|nr:hypothetical protein K457DRAFT_128947 [Linnemannia elongata AG-77]
MRILMVGLNPVGGIIIPCCVIAVLKREIIGFLQDQLLRDALSPCDNLSGSSLQSDGGLKRCYPVCPEDHVMVPLQTLYFSCRRKRAASSRFVDKKRFEKAEWASCSE